MTLRVTKLAAATAPRQAVRPLMTDGFEVDVDYVVYRLEEAGATLLALPGTGSSVSGRDHSNG
jgi:hypothetical protein